MPPEVRFSALVEPDAQLRSDSVGYLLLHHKDIFHLAVVTLGPELVAVGRLDQLHRDAKAVAGATNTPLEHGVDIEQLADLADVVVRAAEALRRRTRDQAQAVDLGESAH